MGERDRQFEQLSAYLDGELSPAEARQLERALQADEPLAAELARLGRLRQLLRSLPAEHAPDDFVARVLEQAERSRLVGTPAARAKAAPFRWVRHLATAAVLAVAVGVGALIVKTFQTTTIEEMAAPVVEVAREDVEKLKAPEDVSERAGGGGSLRPIPAPVAGYTPEHFRKDGDMGSLAAAGTPPRFGKAGTAVASDVDVPNWNINTDNLPDTRKEVEAALARNGLVLLACDTRMVDGREEDLARRELANVYQVNRATPKQVQLLVLVEPSQVSRLKQEVVAIQARQRVRQAPIAAETLDRLAAARHEVASSGRLLLRTEAQATSLASERVEPARPATGAPLVAKAHAPEAQQEATPPPAGHPWRWTNGADAVTGVTQNGIHAGEELYLEPAKPAAGPATRPAEGAHAGGKLSKTTSARADDLAERIATAEKAADKKLDESSGQIAAEPRQREVDECKSWMGSRIPRKMPSPEQSRSVRGGFEPLGEPGAAAAAETRASELTLELAATAPSSQPATVARLARQRQAARLQALLITLNDTQPEQPVQRPGSRTALWHRLGTPTTSQAAEADQTAPGEPNSPK